MSNSPLYTIWCNVSDNATIDNSLCFVKWENGKPLVGNDLCSAMWFDDLGEANKTADKLGDGWEVVDMGPVATSATLKAIAGGGGN